MTRESLNTAVLDSLHDPQRRRRHAPTSSPSWCWGVGLLVLIPIVLLQFVRHRPASPIRFGWLVIMLWQNYESSTVGLGSGISAMPSLHVALTTLSALLLSRLSRTAGVLAWAYLALILVGSVHLGWHYAIDGYASIIAVGLIWRAAGWWASRSESPALVPVPST